MRNFVAQMQSLGFTLIARVARAPNGEVLVRPVLQYALEFAPADIDPAEFVEMSAPYFDPEEEKTMRTLKDVLLDQGRAQGEAKGRQEGEALAILTVLRERFGVGAECVREPLFAIEDHERLLSLLVIAMKAETIEAFEHALAGR